MKNLRMMLKERTETVQQSVFTGTLALTNDEMVIEYYQQAKPWGMDTSVDLYGCDHDSICSAEKICAFVDALCKLIGVRTFGPTVVVAFGDDPRVFGLSMTQLIQTSLVSGHFTDQDNKAYLNIFSCQAYPPYEAAAFSREFFKAKEVKVDIRFRY